ncbi:MAG: IS30 family transposase [Acidimicrobiia bacterium]|nr:IS30 family transposase [Acidimicrobiia bacterium]
MPASPLTACEREEIRAGIERGEPDRVIGDRLGRHRTTINTEINRNGGRTAYTAGAAQARADVQRCRPKVLRFVADVALADHVTARLKAKDSPMTISLELATGAHGYTASVSHECIYQAAYAHGRRGLPKGLHTGLHRRRRCRKRRHPKGCEPTKASPLGEFNLIADRPTIADARGEVGHLEGDLITGAFNRSAIVTIFDRASRHLWLADLPEGHGADATLAALIETLERIPEGLRRTLTWDRGTEMARHRTLAATVGIDIYFADPHSPWQRPTNENGNCLIRRFVGKGTNLAIYTPADLRTIEQRINTIPRRSLHWSTAHDLYTAAVAMTG